ncbi:MAG: ATPase, T2SS/T4P/T4SS family [Halobellus sp.]|uniref:ATPase, T2SS/T4P/T4SS family n=1 Tax=Halobellus sp. TaxID=1979212 RepID=UPI0035D46F11
MTHPLDSLVDGFGGSLSDVARAVLPREHDSDDEATTDPTVCRCRTSFETPVGLGLSERCELVVDADDCPGRGRLESAPSCRTTAIDALSRRDADAVRTRCAGRERTYTDAALALLVAAGRFVERVSFHDESLAERAHRDPLAAAHRATGRAGAVGRIAAESGLAVVATRLDGGRTSPAATAADPYVAALRPFVGPTISQAHASRVISPDASASETRELPTGATVQIVDSPEARSYHLAPVAHDLDDDGTATLAAARDLLASGSVGGGERAPGRAVRRVADRTQPVERIADVLARHTHGLGLLEHLFADEAVSDVLVSAPVTDSPVRVVVDGERLPTNVRLTPAGAASLASRFRRESGRAFSRSSPTLDASLVGETGRQIRVAGVTAPASDGVGFAFRIRGAAAWTLTRLIEAGSITARAASFLSIAVERGATIIVAGTRGAGKTTLLTALLWELPPATRLVSIEDTPELPVASLRERGRDVQSLYTEPGGRDPTAGPGGGSFQPTDALRSALRLGDGALAVGEVRGEEASALYEAMRIGAHGHAVLGTIHGDSAAAVRERVVSDLGVPPSSFGATDLVVTCARDGDERYVSAIEAVDATGAESSFYALFERSDGSLRRCGRIDRGESLLVDRLRGDEESYADLLALLQERTARLDRLATAGLTRPADQKRVRRDVR